MTDGVAELLEAEGYKNCFDASLLVAGKGSEGGSAESGEGGGGVDHNWKGSHPPPTHWTGTCIDHAYGRGMGVIGVYVVPSDLSDHLPVVTDWARDVP